MGFDPRYDEMLRRHTPVDENDAHEARARAGTRAAERYAKGLPRLAAQAGLYADHSRSAVLSDRLARNAVLREAVNRLDAGEFGTALHRSVEAFAASDLAPWEAREMVRFGPEQPPIGTVLRWRRPMPDAVLDYVAVRVGNGDWYVTGQERGPQDWLTIARWIGENECHVAVAWREIPRPEPEPVGDDAVKDWAAQFLPAQEASPAAASGEEWLGTDESATSAGRRPGAEDGANS